MGVYFIIRLCFFSILLIDSFIIVDGVINLKSGSIIQVFLMEFCPDLLGEDLLNQMIVVVENS
jgi:hypothetical protein